MYVPKIDPIFSKWRYYFFIIQGGEGEGGRGGRLNYQ
jgi:hypothetical protein